MAWGHSLAIVELCGLTYGTMGVRGGAAELMPQAGQTRVVFLQVHGEHVRQHRGVTSGALPIKVLLSKF
jgi:hypothetical protein